MVWLTVIALLAGIAYGSLDLNLQVIDVIANNSNFILYALMLFVGISIGLNKGIFHKLKEYHVKIFIIPLGVIVGSVLGGILCSFVTGIAMPSSTAIASGMGWYSLTGVMVGQYAGAQLGSIAFLSNLMREILSFFSIPWIAKHLNYYSCIAPAGATSEDTTLPMMMRYTDESTVVLSVFNGVVCSAVVPMIIEFCYKL